MATPSQTSTLTTGTLSKPPSALTATPLPSTSYKLINGERHQVLDDDFFHSSTANAWSPRKKWICLSIVALCQTSMNFNAAIYSNAVPGINEAFGVTNARMGMVAFLVAYAFGCELWAPWSEDLGRWNIMQWSLGCVNGSILMCALAVNFPMMIAGRVIGGLSSAGGSVTMGMVADMFHHEEQSHAVLFASLFSCLGAVIGGICGGPVQQYLPMRWNFWIQLIFGIATQVVHFFVAKETRLEVRIKMAVEKMRKAGQKVVWVHEEEDTKLTMRDFFGKLKEAGQTFGRPFHMFVCEPIVLLLSLLSGFADALIFSFFESYGYVFAQWNFTPTQISLALVPLAVSYVLAYFSFFPVVRRHDQRRKKGEVLTPEARLWWLLFLVPLLPIGLLGCAFVSTGAVSHWAGVCGFSVLIGMANYAIYYATIDYMVAVYGEKYSASATGGNGFARDFLAGICALYTGPMYHKLGIQKSSFLLVGFAAALCVPVYVFYKFGEPIRKKSKYAGLVAMHREEITADPKRSALRREGVVEKTTAEV